MNHALHGFLPTENRFFDEQITEAQYNSICSAKETLFEALGSEEKLELVVGNLNDLECDLLSATQEHIISSKTEYEVAMSLRLRVDRRIVNLLAGCRLYFDQIGHLISELFGANSAERTEIEKTKNALYDTCFAYRVMEALRNYVQHRGLPVHQILFNAHCVENTGDGMWENTIVPYLVAASLKSDGKFKAAVLQEIENQGERLDIRPLIREYIGCIYSVHKNLRTILEPKLSEAIGLFQSHLERLPKISNLCAVLVNDDGTTKESVAIFRDSIDHYEWLKNRSAGLSRLSRAYVSSAPRA